MSKNAALKQPFVVAKSKDEVLYDDLAGEGKAMIGEVITILDAVILAILVLSLVIGLARGFLRPLITLIGLALIIVGSILLCTTVAQWMSPMFSGVLTDSVRGFLLNKDVVLAEGSEATLFTTELNWADGETVSKALAALEVPSIVSGAIQPVLAGLGTAKLIDVLPPVLAGWALNVIAFVILFFVLTLAVGFIRRAVGKALKIGALKIADRIVGGVLSLLIAYTAISVVLAVVVSFFMDNGFFAIINNFVSEQVSLSSQSSFPLLHFIVNHNFIGEWVINTLLPSITGSAA